MLKILIVKKKLNHICTDIQILFTKHQLNVFARFSPICRSNVIIFSVTAAASRNRFLNRKIGYKIATPEIALAESPELDL